MKKTILATAIIATGMVFHTVSADTYTESNTVIVSENKVPTFDILLEQAREQSSDKLVLLEQQSKESRSSVKKLYDAMVQLVKVSYDQDVSNTLSFHMSNHPIAKFINLDSTIYDFSESEKKMFKHLKDLEQHFIKAYLNNHYATNIRPITDKVKSNYYIVKEAEKIIETSSYSQSDKEKLLNSLETYQADFKKEILKEIKEGKDEVSLGEILEELERIRAE